MVEMPGKIRKIWEEKSVQINKKLKELGLEGEFSLDTVEGLGTTVSSYQKFRFEPVQLKKDLRGDEDETIKTVLEHLIDYRDKCGFAPPEPYVFEIELEEELFSIYLPRIVLTWEQAQYESLDMEGLILEVETFLKSLPPH